VADYYKKEKVKLGESKQGGESMRRRRKRRATPRPDTRVVLCLASSHLMSHPHESQSLSTSNPRVYHKGSGKHNKRGPSRGRGHRGRRPAEFQRSLPLDGDRDSEDEEGAEPDVPYTLGTNADRYEEPEPELGPDGMSSI
jgi:hypothetical protein